MMKPKEYLHSIGKIDNPSQKGKLSAVNKALCVEAAAKGIEIEGYTKPPTAPKPAPKTEKVKPAPKPSGNGANKVIAEYEIFYPNDAFYAQGDDGHKYDMIQACNNCRRSLVQNNCAEPVISGRGGRSVRVTILPKKN